MRSPVDKPRIEITTRVCSLPEQSRWVSICIVNNGPGLSPRAQQRILDSFSVEKRPAKATSLSLSDPIVTAKYGGQFQFQSQSGGGTEFEILLPLV